VPFPIEKFYFESEVAKIEVVLVASKGANPMFHLFFLPGKADGLSFSRSILFSKAVQKHESSHYGRWFRDPHEALNDQSSQTHDPHGQPTDHGIDR
jgi:hypothetical protein